jgi:hypothetical protein
MNICPNFLFGLFGCCCSTVSENENNHEEENGNFNGVCTTQPTTTVNTL